MRGRGNFREANIISTFVTRRIRFIGRLGAQRRPRDWYGRIRCFLSFFLSLWQLLSLYGYTSTILVSLSISSNLLRPLCALKMYRVLHMYTFKMDLNSCTYEITQACPRFYLFLANIHISFYQMVVTLVMARDHGGTLLYFSPIFVVFVSQFEQLNSTTYFLLLQLSYRSNNLTSK